MPVLYAPFCPTSVNHISISCTPEAAGSAFGLFRFLRLSMSSCKLPLVRVYYWNHLHRTCSLLLFKSLQAKVECRGKDTWTPSALMLPLCWGSFSHTGASREAKAQNWMAELAFGPRIVSTNESVSVWQRQRERVNHLTAWVTSQMLDRGAGEEVRSASSCRALGSCDLLHPFKSHQGKKKSNCSNTITKREISLLTNLWSLHPRKDGKRVTVMKLKENVLNIQMRTKTTDLHIYRV